MFKRVMTVLSVASFAACGSSAGPDGGGVTQTPTCSSQPFGIFSIGLCDGGTSSSSTTFFSDGGATIQSADTGACVVDRLGCEFLLVCADSYKSQLSLDWTPATERLSGAWQRNGEPRPLCVVLQKQ